MSAATTANPILARLHANKGMVFPFAFISLLPVLMIPFPPAILDLLLVVSITLSVIVPRPRRRGRGGAATARRRRREPRGMANPYDGRVVARRSRST